MNYSQENILILGSIGIFVIGLIYVLNWQFSKTAAKIKSKVIISPNPSAIINADGNFLLGKEHENDFSLHLNDFKKFCLILGTTGSGKTVTIKNIYSAFVDSGYPVIYVDGKPSEDLIPFLINKANGKFKGFNCGDYNTYDFLSGSASEVKDRIICIKDQWESDYYKTVSSDYVQIVLKHLISIGEPFTLLDILRLMDISKFLGELRNAKSPLMDRAIHFADSLKSNELKGLYSHMSLIINSDFGEYLYNYDNDTIRLDDVIRNNQIAYFALPSLKFPEFSAFIGKVVINDIKSTIERVKKPVLIIFDEFSVFAGGQVLNLINQGREFGAHTIIGTQSLEDLKEWSNQILNNANLLISHRVNGNQSAESICKYIGTKKSFQLTRQMGGATTGEAGSIRSTREFEVHPDELKCLDVGECFINIKDNSVIKKIKINYL